MLYLVPTPIGNLKDITYRAIEVLSMCDYIYAEDTTKSARLLKHYAIQTPTKSYHKFSEAKKLEEILAHLESGKSIALISDAGTPAICDPGARLVKACFDKGVKVTALPGACALSVAASLSGSELPFQFLGFVPKKEKEKMAFLKRMKIFDGLSFAYDTPHQIDKTLQLLGKVEVSIYREMTKLHEEIVRGIADEIEVKPKGEMVLMVKGKKEEALVDEEHLFQLLTQDVNLSPKDAIKVMSKLFKLNKNALYRKFAS